MKTISFNTKTIFRLTQVNSINALAQEMKNRNQKVNRVRIIVRKGENAGYLYNSFTTQSRLLTTQRKEVLKNIEEKEGNAGKQHFLHFPQCFLPN